MTEIATRSLPTDRQLLRAYMPDEPADSAVARARTGGRRIDQLVAAAAAALDDHDRRARAAAVALADAAMNGDAVDAANLALVTGERHVLAETLDQLHQARSIASRRQQSATTTDQPT